MLLTEDCFGNLRSNSNLRRRQANTIDPGIKNPVASVDMLDGSRYGLSQAHYNSLFRSHKICRKKLESKYGSRDFEGAFKAFEVGRVLQRRRSNNDLSKRVLVVAVSEFRTSKCCRGCGSVLRHPNGDDRTSYCETKKGRTPHGTSAKDSAIGIWMQPGRLVRGFWL